jgi:Ca2+-binding RTX toxin-like protein
VVLTSLAEGSHTFRARAIDAAGNADTTPASYTWNVDTMPPDTTIVGNPNNPSNDTAPTFSVSSSQDGSTFEYEIDGLLGTSLDGQVELADLANGSHTFRVWATDTAGNKDDSPATYTWTVDTMPPTVNLTSSPAALSNTKMATFEFEANESNVTFEVNLDDNGFEPGVNGITFNSLGEGEHTFQVRATDPVGNVGPAASYVWTVDTTPPETTITGRPPALTNVSSATFDFEANEAGVSFEYKLDDGSFTASDSSLALAALAEGSHTFQVRAVDAAGNVGPAASHMWTVDTMGPTTTIVNLPGDPSSDLTPSFSFSASEAITTFEYQLDGGPFVATGNELTVGPLTEGGHTILVRATDLAGNTGDTASYSWTNVAAPAPASAAIVPDPQSPGKFMLSVVGTEVGDSIVIESRPKNQVRVMVSGTPIGVFHKDAFRRIVGSGLGGNDTIVIDSKIEKPAELHGGSGNDSLIGTDRLNVLYGDDGDDVLHGNAGRDVLFGGPGSDMLFGNAGDDLLNGGPDGNDVLVGGRGDDLLVGGADRSLLIGGDGHDLLLGGLADDILIGGSTKYDANSAALLSILNEWRRDLPYPERVDHLTGKTTAGGLNNGVFLKNSTVKDNDFDGLAGGEGQDWFWALAKEVAGRKADERLN